MQTVANVLIMALMQLPEADFTMLLHLIPENIQVSLLMISHNIIPAGPCSCNYQNNKRTLLLNCAGRAADRRCHFP